MKKTILSAVLVVLLIAVSAMVMADMNIKWKTVANHPTYIKAGVMGWFEGTPYSIAGIEYPWEESADSYSYEISLNQWWDRPDMPVGRAYTQGIDVGDTIYVCGGRKTDSIKYSKAECYKMNRVGGNITWTQISSLVEHAALTAIGKVGTKVILAGGSQFYGGASCVCGCGGSGTQIEFHDVIDRVQYYDTAYPNNGWNNYATIPTHARGASAGCGLGSYFYLFGGCYYSGGANGNYIRMYQSHKLNPSTNTWSNIADLPYGLSGAVAVPYDDRFIIILGGYYNDGVNLGYDDRCLVYDSVDDDYTTQPNDILYGCNDMRAVITGNKIYCVGGERIDYDHSHTDNHMRIGTITFPSISFLDADGDMDRSYDKKTPTFTTASFFYNPEDSLGWTFNSGSNSRKPMGVGDVTGDGYDDVVVIDSSGNIVCLQMSYTGCTDDITLGNPKTSWSWPLSSSDTGTLPLGVGDYNNDGYADIFVIESDGDVKVLTTNGSSITGNYQVGNPYSTWSWDFQSDTATTDALGIADLNNDGYADIYTLANGWVRVITTNGELDGSGMVSLYDLGEPSSGSALSWPFSASNHTTKVVKIADVDGNGMADIVCVDTSGTVMALPVVYTTTYTIDFDNVITMSDPYSDNRFQSDQSTTKPLDVPYGWSWWW